MADPPYNRSVFAKALEDRLDQLDWTQAGFARRVGVYQQTVSKWIRGETTPRPGMIVRIAKAMGSDPQDLLQLAMLAHEAGASEDAANEGVDRSRIEGAGAAPDDDRDETPVTARFDRLERQVAELAEQNQAILDLLRAAQEAG